MSVHVLYRMFNEHDQLLYVGITMNPPARFKHHKFNKQWWEQVASVDLQHFPSKQALRAAERKAIQKECPLYNVHNNQAAADRRRAELEAQRASECCECDVCDYADECSDCDACTGHTGPYVLVEYQETAS